MQRRTGVAVWVGALLVFAFVLRCVGFENVFPGDGTVVFAQGDAPYHARRALWTLLNFPSVLHFDAFMNYPAGAFVPWPPGFDWSVAAIAWLLGGEVATFERVAVWSAPILGALTVLPIWRLGRLVHSDAVGLGAASIYAALPIVVGFARVGNFDHHPAQALLGATLVLLYARALDPQRQGRALLGVFVGLAFTRAALALVWQGSFLYLGPGELSLVAVAAWTRRSDLLAAQALSAALTALLIAPFLPAGHVIGGDWSAVELSRLHVFAYAACAAVAAGAYGLAAWRPASTGFAGLTRVLTLAAGLAAVALAFPEVRAGLAPALDFVSQSDEYGALNLENQPLFAAPGAHVRALLQMGGYAYLVPLAPLALLWTAWRRESRAPLVFLAGWAALAALLGLGQNRYLNDFAPIGCVGFALALVLLAEVAAPRLPGPRWLPRALAVALGVALLGPVLPIHAGGLKQSFFAGRKEATLGPAVSLQRFAALVKQATPSPGPPYAAGSRPEYSILAHVGIGHILEYGAERPTPADNFGPYIGLENFRAVQGFAALVDEDEAIEVLHGLAARYLATLYTPQAPDSPVIVQRLHHHDGDQLGELEALSRFRLVTEGPKGGVSVAVNWGLRVPAGRVVPYKLFEAVEGARVTVQVSPDVRVRALVRIETNQGRVFTHELHAIAGSDGLARLRLPYATQTEAPVRPVGPYQISAGDRSASLVVAESDVQDGNELFVSLR